MIKTPDSDFFFRIVRYKFIIASNESALRDINSELPEQKLRIVRFKAVIGCDMTFYKLF